MRRAGRRWAGVALTALLLAQAACASSTADLPPPRPVAPCGWWYAIGDTPTPTELDQAAKRYRVVVLNAWETAALRRLKDANKDVKVLVYKDLSSTRNYRGAVIGDQDAQLLPTGIGYYAAQRGHPEWFALDTSNQRIEWSGYPKHWQMTVWQPGYQKAWSDAVTKEVVDQGWDGVLADNDFNSLIHYSKAVIAGTKDAKETDRLLRDGLDALLGTVGDALEKQGKIFVPNVSETHLTPGRWTAHSRYGGAMEENFGFRDDGGNGELLTFRGNEFKELRAQAALGESWLLLATRVKSPREDRAGYASAALLAGPMTCWMGATTDDYHKPDWSPLQNTGLGEATDVAHRDPDGTWTRPFTGGWVAVNPTSKQVTLTPPSGMYTLEGKPVSTVTVPGADAVVLTKNPPKPTTSPKPTTPPPPPPPPTTTTPPPPTSPTPPPTTTQPTTAPSTTTTPPPATTTAPPPAVPPTS